ncbi:MAG: ACT domain-containing protein, partial [Actinobacteria bacterium]|nr:ACT domain-containing protein [Actinomycetota bacterium]
MRVARPAPPSQGGSAALQRAADMDRALLALAQDTIAVHESVAVVAVGGYGRGHLSPYSDIDLLVLAAGGDTDVDRQRLRAFTYALWDAGWQVGHALRSPSQAVDFASRDLPAATSILTTRLIAGNADVFDDFCARRDRWQTRKKRSLLRRLMDATRHRHREAERAGWALAPDLKEDVGGLRDVHALGWMEAIAGSPDFGSGLEQQSGVLLAAREGLHATLRRKSDKLHFELQPEVARRLGFVSDGAADAMMTGVHAAARDIEFTLTLAMEDLSRKILGGPRRSGRSAVITSRVRLEDSTLRFVGEDVDVTSSLELLAAHATTGHRISLDALNKMTLAFEGAKPGVWTEDQRSAFFEVLRGRHGPAALELLEHLRGWDVLVPEWSRIRGRPQHDPYHRYTVDGHSFVAVGELTACLDEPVPSNHAHVIGDLSTLYLGTLLHDLGKGNGRDHSVEGASIAAEVARRMGMNEVEIQEVAELVRYHLLLPDTATRRDLDDGSVIKAVVAKTGDGRRLRQLLLLAIADGRATGPHAWNEWKASLVANLVNRVLEAFETGEVPLDRGVAEAARRLEAFEPALAGRSQRVLASLPPSYVTSTPVADMADEIRLLATGVQPGNIHSRLAVGSDPEQSILTVCVADRPGTLARVAGVLALNRIDVLAANAYTTTDGLALTRVTVTTPNTTAAERCLGDLEAAFSGHLAVDARMRSKVSDYSSGIGVQPDIRILHDASMASTVVEVRGPNELGLLYALTAGLADLDLDIHVAKIDTLGDRVVDVFYVRSQWGSKLS